MDFHPVFEVLERAGLKQLPDFDKAEEWQEADFRRVHEQLYGALMPSALSSAQTDEGVLDPFRFVASASMRGDAGCSEPFCRHQKLSFLARYAALYATSVVIPIGLPSPEHLDELSYGKPLILNALFTLLSGKVLINSGRLLPTIMRTTHHCEHEIQFVRGQGSNLGVHGLGCSELRLGVQCEISKARQVALWVAVNLYRWSRRIPGAWRACL